MATVGTLFVNIAAKTQPFIAAVRGSAKQLRAMATTASSGVGSSAATFGTKYSAALAAYGRTTKSMFTGQAAYSGFSKMSAAMFAVSPSLGKAGFALERFGVRAGGIAKNIGGSFKGLANTFGFGRLTGLLSLVAVGTFFAYITKLSISRFVELRKQLYDLTRQWRVISYEAARAFAPAIKAVMELMSIKLKEWFDSSNGSLQAMAQGAVVVAGLFFLAADAVKMIWNIITILGRTILLNLVRPLEMIEAATDAAGLTDSSTNMFGDVAKELEAGILGDIDDVIAAGKGMGTTWDKTQQGIIDAEAGPGAAGLTESGYGGSAQLIDEARRQNAQLQRIENAILRTGGLT
jgi:hypothetical protein